MNRSDVVSLLRERARGGGSICALMTVLRADLHGNLNSFAAVGLVMDAFDVPLTVAQELEGARCMGNAASEDHDVDALIAPYIREALSRYGA